MIDVLIRDERADGAASTYTAKTGIVTRTGQNARLTLKNGVLQQLEDDGSLKPLSFESYEIDLTEIMALDPVLRLKTSDRFLHELLRPDPREYSNETVSRSLLAEGHARLATPLYNVALALLALAFMMRGEFQKLGYGRRIATCAVIGFVVRLGGFALVSASESNVALNAYQYALPLIVGTISLLYLLRKTRARAFRHSYSRKQKIRINVVAT
jgi:lipopolysaccharide export system permease protein